MSNLPQDYDTWRTTPPQRPAYLDDIRYMRRDTLILKLEALQLQQARLFEEFKEICADKKYADAINDKPDANGFSTHDYLGFAADNLSDLIGSVAKSMQSIAENCGE
jgi:hypothetical protein